MASKDENHTVAEGSPIAVQTKKGATTAEIQQKNRAAVFTAGYVL